VEPQHNRPHYKNGLIKGLPEVREIAVLQQHCKDASCERNLNLYGC